MIKTLVTEYVEAATTKLIHTFITLLTPRSRVLPEKLRGPQLLKKFPVFYGTRRFITAFTRACHLPLARVRSIQSVSPIPLLERSILIVSSLYAWVFQVAFFLQVSPPKLCMYLSSSPYALHALPISVFLIRSPD